MPLSPQQKEEYKERFFSSSRVYVDFGDGVKHDTSIIKKKAADEISNWWIKVIEEETSKAYSQGREDMVIEIAEEIYEKTGETQHLNLKSFQLPDNKPEK